MTDDLIKKIHSQPLSKGAWSDWYRKAYPAVFYFGFKRCRGDRDLSKDLTQEAFLRFLKYDAIDKVTTEKQALSYLFATLQNLHHDHVRKRTKESEVLAEVSNSIEESAETDTSWIDLEVASKSLNDKDREVLELAIAGRTVSEIATITNSSYVSTGVRLHRLRKRLRSVLSIEG